jgi:hypothetical protein
MTANIRYQLVRRRLRPAILATNTDNSAPMRCDTPESRFPLFHGHPNHVDTFHSFDIFNFDVFDFVVSSLENSATYDLVSLARVLPLPHVQERNAGEGGAMSPVLIFIRRWNKWYRVLRYRKGFGLLDSVRYGLWLAHS